MRIRRLFRRSVPGLGSAPDQLSNSRKSTADAGPSIGRLAPLVGLPPAHFNQLYREPVRWLAAKTRAPDDGHPALEESLAFAERVLLVRQAYLLPANTAPEDAVRRSDCWTYGLFLAALFHHASVAAASEGRGEAWAKSVLSGLPRSGRDWMACDPDLPTRLRAVLLDKLENAGVLADILARAKATTSSDPNVTEEVEESGREAHLALLADVPAAMATLIDGGQLPINQEGGLAWVTTQDLWLMMTGGFDLVRDWFVSKSAKLPPSSNDLLDELLRQGVFVPVPASGKAMWRMVVSGVGKSKVECLLRMPIDRVWPDPDDRPAPYWGKITKPLPRPETTGKPGDRETVQAR